MDTKILIKSILVSFCVIFTCIMVLVLITALPAYLQIIIYSGLALGLISIFYASLKDK
jgi:hypothetical protein